MKTTLSLLLLTSLNLGASEFPSPYNSEPDRSKPMPALEAARGLQLPPGFRATVFASEPDVQNPIAMAWDARGRLWVAENFTYAESGRKFDLNLRDRILIFEDTDGDGRFDVRKVFTDEIQMLTSIEVGFGGVWVMTPPQLRFIPDRDRDDVPDGPGEVVLDGLTGSPDMHHTFANGLRFGPDGWLYGRCGASSAGAMGVPGTPPEQRVPVRGTLWRYHPQRKVVEALSSGTTNPWGHDWNEHGELFFINTVNGHLWHGIVGAHYDRPHTVDPNARVYELIEQHADHWHFNTNNGWQKSRDGVANDLGGGHAHIGMMIYQGGSWPPEYRGRLFTLNLHGRRANQEILERQGSGYVGKHGPDFFAASDPWFRGMDIRSGPDGGAFVLDWSDIGECHEYSGVHRTSGRIYKIVYEGNVAERRGAAKTPVRTPASLDVAHLNGRELARLHTNANEWLVHQARIELAGRAATNAAAAAAAAKELREYFDRHRDLVVKLRALWTLHVIGATDETFLRAQLSHPNEHVRTWAIRLLTDMWPLDTVLSQRPVLRSLMEPGFVGSPATRQEFLRLARTDPSGLVRLALASTMQRLAVAQRAELATLLVAHREDAHDHNLPLLLWYGLIPVADLDPVSLVEVAVKSELPVTRKLIARRLVEDIEKNPIALNALLRVAANKPVSFQTDVLVGMSEGLIGWHKAKKPASWETFANKLSASPEGPVGDRVRDLSALFGDGRALETVEKVALDADAEMNARKRALQTLIDRRAPKMREVCEQLLSERYLNAVAARGLAGFDDVVVGAKLVRAYRQFDPADRGSLLSTLVSRPSFARTLLDAVADRKIPRAELSTFHARQIHTFHDAALDKKLSETWGELRELPTDKRQLIQTWKTRLTPAVLARADLGQGRLLFNTACAACHTLHGEGGQVGPDLTGSGRENLDYLLENVVDPSAVVGADFRMSVIEMKDGRVFNALITARSERVLTFKTMNEALSVERSEIAAVRESTLSLMPEGLLEALSVDQARDLVGYLMHKTQVPLLKVSGQAGSH